MSTPYPDKLPTRKFILRYRGICDFEGVYNLIAEYYKAQRFHFQEGAYKHKTPSVTGAEQEIELNGTLKVTEYIQYDLSVNIHLWDMTEVEVERKGIKKKLLSSKFEIIFQGFVYIDYEKRYSSSPVMAFLQDFWHKHLAKEEIETVYWDTLHYRTQAFMNTIKEFLDMEAKGYEYSGYLGDNV